VNFVDVVQQALNAFQETIQEHDHTLHVDIPQQPLTVYGDPSRLEQIVTNLLSNAVKYTDPGGEIRVHLMADQNQLIFSVRDSGIGLKPEQLHVIFELFTQVESNLERTRGGLGIGLTLVKRLTEMHEGSISVYSEGPGKGSEFRVTLPLSHPQEQGLPVHQDQIKSAGLMDVKMLIVDDNVDFATSLSHFFEDAGLKHYTAHDGLSALRSAREINPAVIILDIGLPLRNGYEIVSELRQDPAFHETLFIALTGYGQESDIKKSNESGFDIHLTKPVDNNVLLHIIQDHLAKQQK
jgi:CheY-like chemotaxis protein